MPDKKVIEFGFRNAFGAAPIGPHAERLLKIGDQRAALVKMEKDMLEPVVGWIQRTYLSFLRSASANGL